MIYISNHRGAHKVPNAGPNTIITTTPTMAMSLFAIISLLLCICYRQASADFGPASFPSSNSGPIQGPYPTRLETPGQQCL